MVSDAERERIRTWLIANDRRCPACEAGPESLLPVSVEEGLHPDAAGAHGIDTGMTARIARITCTSCGFDKGSLVLEDAGLA